MPLNGSATVFALIMNGGPVWGAVLEALATWLVANTQVLPGQMVSASGSVTGAGAFSVSTDVSSLGVSLAKAACSTIADPTAKALGVTQSTPKWTAFGSSVVSWINSYCTVDPTGFVATNTATNPGAVTGTAKFKPGTAPMLQALFVKNLPVTDAPGMVAWLLPATQIAAWIAASAQVKGIGGTPPLTAPAGDGPLTGTGTIL